MDIKHLKHDKVYIICYKRHSRPRSNYTLNKVRAILYSMEYANNIYRWILHLE